MAKSLFAATILLACFAGITKGYVIVTPNVFFVGETATGFVTSVTDAPKSTLSAYIYKGNGAAADEDIVVGPVVFGAHSSGNLSATFNVPSNVEPGSDFLLKFVGTIDGKKVDQNVTIELRSVKGSMRIVTDKPIYKPGQTLNARVIALDAMLKPFACELEVTVSDPQDAKMARYRLNTSKGFAEFTMPISLEPVLGEWKMVAECTDGSVLVANAVFEIAEYVLPKFKVSVAMPSTLYKKEAEQSGLSGVVTAEYTYGKKVKGTATISLFTTNQYAGTETVLHTMVVELDGSVTGAKFKFDIDTSTTSPSSSCYQGGGMDMLRMRTCYFFPSEPSPLMVRAVVSETGTGIKQNETATTTTAEYPVTYSFDFLRTTMTPGLPFEATLKATNLDGTPAVLTPGTDALLIPKVKMMQKYTTQPSLVDGKLTGGIDVACVPTTTAGECKTTVARPANETYIQFMASPVGNEYSSKKIYKAKSTNGCYLRVHPTWICVDKTIHTVLRSGCKFEAVTAVVLIDGSIATSLTQTVVPNCSSSSCETNLPITLPPDVGASSGLLTVYTTINGELVSDSVRVSPSSSLSSTGQATLANTMTMQANASLFTPGDHVAVTVNTDGTVKGGTSLIALTAIDKSVLLLKNHTPLTSSSFLDEQKATYDVSKSVESSYSSCFYGKHVFAFGGLAMLTDSAVPVSQSWECRPSGIGGGDDMIMFAQDDMMMEKSAMRGGAAPAATSSQASSPRTYFPETWIFFSNSIEDGEDTEFEFKVPDTMTSWSLDGFAVSSANGIGLADNIELTVFKKFFISMVLPYSVVRGETFELKIAVYNYADTDTDVSVALQQNLQGFVIESEAAHTMRASAGGPTVVSFVVRPLVVGNTLITASGSSPTQQDTVVRSLLVKPEGIRREYVSSTLIDIDESGEANAVLSTAIPTGELVPGSASIKVTATADLMGPSINGVDRLIRMPTGCGEQNMITFAPIISVYAYLLNTGQLTNKLESSSKKYMVTGYQRELTYRHSNGGFSAFGEGDKLASTWLTAFVLRSFALADDYVYVDPAVLAKSVTWVMAQQTKTGSFESVGKVIHQDMMGGVQGPITLSAYVTAALIEARSVALPAGNWESAWDAKLDNAIAYIRAEVDGGRVTGSYRTTLVCFALVRAAKAGLIAWDDTTDIYTTMMSIATKDGDAMYWKDTTTPSTSQPKQQFWSPPYHSTDVEATSYALLAIVTREDSDKLAHAYPVVRWLGTSRNGDGGWQSTQDTIMALESLAVYAQLAYGEIGDLTLSLASSNSGWKGVDFGLDTSNFGVFQSAPVPANVSTIAVAATGTGTVLVSAIVTWYESMNIAPVDPPPIVVKPKCDMIQGSDVRIACRICVRTQKNVTATGFSVIESSLFTGLSVEDTPQQLLKTNQVTAPVLKRIDVVDNQVSFYIDELTDTDVCVEYTAVKTAIVADLQPIIVSAYDYYNTGVRGSVKLSAHADLSPSVEALVAVSQDNNAAANSTPSASTATLATTPTIDTVTTSASQSLSTVVLAGSIVAGIVLVTLLIVIVVVVVTKSSKTDKLQMNKVKNVAISPVYDTDPTQVHTI
eukprot:m.214278 g.214278  ORF g.214278 m.214278 type:complete len:1577 (-) comp33172_c0_seq2:291-5021(-)